MNKDKSEEKLREDLTQCAGLMQDVAEKGVNRIYFFHLDSSIILFVITLAEMRIETRRLRRITKSLGC